jgi:type VI protein secretion system component VasK
MRKPSFRQSSDPTRNPPANPWWYVTWYLLIVTAVAVAVPFMLAWPDLPWVLVVVLVVALWALCFTRTSISGLPARTGELRDTKEARDTQEAPDTQEVRPEPPRTAASLPPN